MFKNKRAESNKLLLDSIRKIKGIRKNGDILAICGTPTGSSWLGVNVATKSLFPNNTFEMPQYYSNVLLTENDLTKLAEVISSLNFSQVIYSGYAIGYLKLSRSLSKKIVQKVIHHGFLSELSGDKTLQEIFNLILKLGNEKVIHSFGFVKKGLALSIKKMYDFNFFEIILPNNNIRKIKKLIII